MRRLPDIPEHEKKELIKNQIRKLDKANTVFLVFEIIIVVLFFVPIIFGLIFSPFVDNFKYRTNGIDCKIQCLDSDYGNTVYIECEGENVLIDCGTTEHSVELLDFFTSNGINNIDYLFISDANEEYIETLEEIINTVEIMKVVIPVCNEEMYSLYDEFLFRNGKTLWTNGEVVHFNVNKMKFEIIDKDKMSFKIMFGDNSFLICNSIDENKVSEIINSESNIDLDALVLLDGYVPSDKFLETFSPDFLVINCKTDVDISSADKFVKHIYRTNKNGDIIIKSNEVDIKIECENQ